MSGFSYPENRKFKVASPAADASWGVGDGKEEEVWFSWPASPLFLGIFSFLFSNPQFQERIKRKHPNARKEQAVTVLVSDFYPIWNF